MSAPPLLPLHPCKCEAVPGLIALSRMNAVPNPSYQKGLTLLSCEHHYLTIGRQKTCVVHHIISLGQGCVGARARLPPPCPEKLPAHGREGSGGHTLPQLMGQHGAGSPGECLIAMFLEDRLDGQF